MLQARDYIRRRFANRAVKHFEALAPMASDVVAPAAESAAANGHREAHSTAGFTALLIGSIGVVYGDIGTSPLYAFREAVVAASGSAGAVTPQAVLGVLSLILWALIIVVTLKYVMILLRADNNGEGGTLALMALAQRAVGHGAGAIVLLGIIRGALFYGDAVITGAYSLTRQAIQLGLLPRFEIRHTSAPHSGQLFIPRINLLLFTTLILD